MGGLLKEIADKLDSYDREQILSVASCVSEAISQGIQPSDILNNGLFAGLERVGAKFKVGDAFISDVLIVAKAINESMEILRPLIKQSDIAGKGKIVIGTVKGDLHDIGKNLVRIMLESAGFDVIDIGINQPAENFIAAVKNNNAKIVGLSALLTTTMAELKNIVSVFKEKGMDTKIIVGGAPVTQHYADEIGADAYGENAADAVEKVRNLNGS
ncbi:MAG: cobalamin-binding protein [Desulforudis sp.]|jgi:5-methyltetrahydrofolate--homocysteine methyltransferase|nr:MAG: cobalamin-binding protein [Desulforudis sp.]